MYNTEYRDYCWRLPPYRSLAAFTVADPAVWAEFPVAGPDGAPVSLPCAQTSSPTVSLLAKGLAGGGDCVERNDVPERSDVGIADQRQWTLKRV